jgi:hypothetical protein
MSPKATEGVGSTGCDLLQQTGLAFYARRPPFCPAGHLPRKGGDRLDHSHDYVCLDFGGNLAAAMSVRNCGCGVVGCRLQFSRVSGLDFVAKKRSLTISNGWNARRGCTA